ncbi:MAG: hypothetical protein GXP45_00320 [bacterium]|nr:hypothetical protein [bacterium]
MKAPDIVKILENMYFDGIKNQSSSLIGVILIGNIPLPVVNTQGFLYPSIYPYVDFEDQQFIFDGASKSFVFNNNSKAQAELWHGLIKFDAVDDYHRFFDKLRSYAQDPGNYAKKQIWYDDFIALKEYYNPDNIPYYINSFLFADDIGYRRYNNLMLDMLQGSHNAMMNDVL